MGEWSTCPHCQLKHSARNDGLCPRCRQPVAGAMPYGPPDAPVLPPEPSHVPPQAPSPGGTVYGGAGTVYGGPPAGGVYGGPSYPARPPLSPPAKSGGGLAKGLIATVVALVVIAGLRTLGSGAGTGLIFKYRYGLGDQPVTQVQGEAFPYRITVPAAHRWFLRSDESAHGDNADADRWLVCPDRNAHVVVIAEDVAIGADQYIDMDKLVDLVVDNMRKAVPDYTVHTTHHISQPIGGRLIHGTAHVEGIDVELYHAVFIDGHRVYQVLAFAEKKYFPEMGPELDQTIKTMHLGT